MLPLPSAAGSESGDLEGHTKTASASRLRFIETAPGEYALAPTGVTAAAPVSDGAGGYVLTIGATASDAMIAQVGTTVILA